MFSYKPLFRMMFENGITKMELKNAIGFSPATLAKLSKNEYVSMKVLDDICDYFHCEISDIIEHKPTE